MGVCLSSLIGSTDGAKTAKRPFYLLKGASGYIIPHDAVFPGLVFLGPVCCWPKMNEPLNLPRMIYSSVKSFHHKFNPPPLPACFLITALVVLINKKIRQV